MKAVNLFNLVIWVANFVMLAISFIAWLGGAEQQTSRVLINYALSAMMCASYIREAYRDV